MSSLLWASGRGHWEIVKLLLVKGAKSTSADKYGTTALVWACRKGYKKCVQALLQCGANVDTAGMNSWTPLIAATKGNYVNVVKLLLEYSPNVNAVDKDGHTALFITAKEGYTAVAAALIGASAYINVPDRDGETPLLRAVRHRNIDIVKMLLERHAKVSAVDKRGDTVLHIALRNRHKAITEMLLRNPKDGRLLYRPNNAGETPYSIDEAHQKGILTQIFGARRLNTPEDNENMLGYDLYSMCVVGCRFLFSDYHRLTTVGGEKTLARTMGTLCDALEAEFGALTVRLVRVFGREPDANDGRWKTVCCAPCWLVALTLYCLAVAGAALLTYGVQRSPAVYVATITIGCLIAAAAVANALTWWRLAESVVHSQKRRVLHAADRTDTTKMD
ncbi:PREDICTED: kinase D-interacting substrate of 220 kDa-like, partial [Priapulus caudatus]|uniref:Kinase D-interacting substrate of 220 kDa-like n=1 Tax=Priapulus caudatus TaxID=37621 RepID=A0ABM1F620_PRICU